MKIEFTPALTIALDFAQRFANHRGAAQVELRHVLTGLLSEDEGKPAQILAEAGADWPGVQAHFGLPATLDGESRDLPTHTAVREMMVYARELAIQHGSEGSISTDHVLLAIVNRSSTLREELEALGLDVERLRHGIAGEMTPLIMDDPLVLQDPTGDADTARILDANANRAREGLRVLEDHARFVLNDAYLSRELKQLRHALANALQLLPASLLLASRDTLTDVGTAIRTDAEFTRPSLAAVAHANAKRLQEALRSLEEYGKILSSEFAEHIEKMRYQTYTLERALIRRESGTLADARLCVLVTDSLCRASLVGTVKEAILGGAGMIQLREKNLDDRTLLARARDVGRLAQSSGALFIVNDRPDIARLVDADGVHLGQDDMTIQDARRIVGPDALIGVSTHNVSQVRRAVLEGADYLGVGPTFSSKTKDFSELAGLEFVRQAFAETSLPAFAIGGIHLDNIALVRSAGGTRVAVSNAVCAAPDARAAARQLLAALTQQAQG